MNLLAKKIKEIEMPDDMRERIIKNCYKNIEAESRKSNLYENSRTRGNEAHSEREKNGTRKISSKKVKMKSKTGETRMKKRKENSSFKRIVHIAATLVLCVCLTGITALAATEKLQGFFKDIKNWNGAVTGTIYEQATEEITISVEENERELSVLITMMNPEKPPYIFLEEFGIASYRIEDMSGKAVISESSTSMVPLNNEQVTAKIPLDNISNGNYKLIIDAFVGGSKADQPLRINGNWMCEFEYIIY